VNVVLLPIRRANGTLGLLAGRRGIQPGLGELSLPAGYQDVGESPREGAARELREELGVKINPDDLSFYDLRGNRPNTQIIMCWVAREMPEEALPSFVQNDEVTERLIVDRGEDMAFSSHKRWVERFLSAKPDPGREEIGKAQ
jgi:ADP-ribose pyrophosphatase YjhB (NUDIX family)